MRFYARKPEKEENSRNYSFRSAIYALLTIYELMASPQKEQRRKKKLKFDPSMIGFDVGKQFSPAEAKEEDLNLDIESSRFKAQKGEGGDRRA